MGGLWKAYVRAVSGSAPQKEIADRAGVNQSSVSRWLKGDKVPIEGGVVASFCRGYGRNPVEGFVAAGMLSELEAGTALKARERAFLAQLRDADPGENVTETARRIAGRAREQRDQARAQSSATSRPAGQTPRASRSSGKRRTS